VEEGDAGSMNILVAGGAGYIGTHTCVALLEAGHSVIIADDLVNSKVEAVDKVFKPRGTFPRGL